MCRQEQSSRAKASPGCLFPLCSCSPSTMADQSERAYQKQTAVYENRSTQKRSLTTKLKPNQVRYVKNVGLGFKTPRECRQMAYIDKKCPFTGDVSIRGRIQTGIIRTMKMKRTCTIRRDYLHYIKKYNRFEKRHKNFSAHISPCFRDAKIGDLATVGQCRPLSKTVRFNVLRVSRIGGGKKEFNKF